MIISQAKKIAVLRANALGDFLVTLPAIEAIRRAYPNAELVLLGKEWHKEFLSAKRCAIDRVIVVPVCKGIREEKDKQEDPEEIQRFFEQIRKEEFDIALQFQGKGIAANPFIKNIGAKLTAGLTCKDAIGLDLCIDFYYYQPEVLRYLEVAKLVGADILDLEPSIEILPEDYKSADAVFNSSLHPYIAIHPVGMDIRRMWTEKRFAALADEIKQRGFEVVFTGASQDKEYVERILSNMKHTCINLTGKFNSLGSLAAVFKASKVTVAVDTGPLHLARAAGANTVGLYWAPNLINWGPLTREKHRPVISWNLPCPICGIIPNDPYPFEPVTTMCNHNVSF